MEVKIVLNGKPIHAHVEADLLLIDFLRSNGCYSVSADAIPPTVGCVLY